MDADEDLESEPKPPGPSHDEIMMVVAAVAGILMSAIGFLFLIKWTLMRGKRQHRSRYEELGHDDLHEAFLA
jgi:hypothetical protein